jgi:uncharacterized protein YdaU (DUF1376 family)
MNYYPHHIGDFNHATRHLNRIERSIYRDLIEHYYDTEQPLSLDIVLLCRKILAISLEEITAVEQVLQEFFTETEEGYINNRCQNTIDTYQNSIHNKSKAGKASAKARKANKQKGSSNSTGVEQVLNKCSSGVHNQEPITKNQEPKEKIPYPQIVESYNNNFANSVEGRGIIKLENITPDRKRAIKKLIEHSKKLDIEHWNNYFKYCAGVPFLNGSTDKYKADFDMLIRVKSYIKNTEGGYQ